MLHEYEGGIVGLLQCNERYFKGRTVHEVDMHKEPSSSSELAEYQFNTD